MRFASLASAILATSLLVACVATAPNLPQPAPPPEDPVPDDGRYTVTYRGAPNSSAARVRDLALLRAASVTLSKGGDWFEVVTEYSRIQKDTQTDYELDPFGEAISTRAECGVLGCTSTARPDVGQPDIDPAKRTRSFTVQSFEIMIHSGIMPFGRQNAYDALEVSKEMRAKYSTNAKN